MAMFEQDPVRPAPYERFARETPAWFRDAKLGIFVHWGPYAVPAWAEPIGPLGAFDHAHWMAHNPYAEWYANTMRIVGSPAWTHHQDVHGGAPYDAFLDRWRAERFDADAVMDLVSRAGARYFVPTAKHHDGVTLWDAPGTGDRNTVRRGPRRDLLGEFREAAQRHGVRFGLYYSGGLDWWYDRREPITGPVDDSVRPVDRAYADYAYDHVVDLIERYRPDVLWGDIEWPDAGKAEGGKSLVDLFDRFYAAAPDGVVNDRFGLTHWDFRTSEYEEGRVAQTAEMWEHTRGVGFSFGHNRLEDERHSLDGRTAIRHFVDVVSRGGNLLLNIGLTAAGEVTSLQRRTLEELGSWNAAHGDGVFGSHVLDPEIARPSDEPWVRWTRRDGRAHAFADGPIGASVPLDVDLDRVHLDGTECQGAEIVRGAHGIALRVLAAGPVHVAFPLR
ncbi:alpha-L-fucosidase [Microbacterium oryzae]|uniref:alpha-L-fucosidase n=1 Tax=Microbacterium oryzae TaxID=743009 RepID=UPI0025B19D9D|nr:alpha-L-fucosidase [Microbacterium oryzae]MDN3309769.1 alpha-L-fucosidase [Microbacterium oryzae]